MPITKDGPPSLTAGIATILATVFAMALTDAIVKYSSAAMPLWQIYVLRSLFVVPVLLFLARGCVRPAGLGWILLRSLALTLMYLGIYAAVPVLDLSVIAASLYTGPLFIVVLSAVVLRERVTVRHWIAILIGLAGVLLIVRPAASGFTPLALVPVAAAFLYAVAAALTRAKCSHVPAFTLALWLNLTVLAFGILASLLIALVADDVRNPYPFLFGPWTRMGGRDMALVALLAILMIAVSIGLAKAYQSPRPQVIATFDYAYLAFAALWGFVFFGEIPDSATLAGMASIAAAGAIVLRGGTRDERARAPAAR